MRPQFFLVLELGCAALGAAGLWWFVLRERPTGAIAYSMSAAAVAGYVEIIAKRRWV